MKIERIADGEWGWVERFLLEHLREIGSGLEAADVPGFRMALQTRENWFVRAEQDGVMGLFVFLRTGEKEFEVHAAGSARGWKWIGLSRRVLRWFVKASGATTVRTYVSAENSQSAVFVKACGMRSDGSGWKGIGRLGQRLVRWFAL